MRAPLINKCVRAREGSFYAMSESTLLHKVLCRSIVGPISLKCLHPMRNDRIGNSPVEILIKN